MSNNIDDYIWCNDESSLGDAVIAIQNCSEVVLDCEGRDLGREGGLLSLISFRTIGSAVPETYLIDFLAFTNDVLQPVFDILQSSSLTKIMFDGRMDYSELLHGSGTPIENVLDLQLADIYSRGQRGEDKNAQLRRLSPYLKRSEVAGQSTHYAQVQKLGGLQQCLNEHGLYSGRKLEISHTSWLKRPVPREYLCYAARDVYLIGLVYTHFRDEGYISRQLSAQSDRYVSIWKDAKPQRADNYRSHGLLPLQILDYSSGSSVRTCSGCQRNLSRAAYSTAAWNESNHRRCWVCQAIYLKGAVPRRHFDIELVCQELLDRWNGE